MVAMTRAWLAVPRFGLALLALLALSGCPFSSERPLSDPAQATRDDALVGSWRMQDPETQQWVTLRIYPFDERELVGVTRDESDPRARIDAYRLFSTTVNGQRFLNAQELTPDTSLEWFLALYTVSDTELTLRFVDDALFSSRTFDTSDALRQFVQQNLADPKLYAGESGEPFQSVWQRVPW